MKIVCLAENLQKKLGIANKAISSRNQLPILSHVLLEAKENMLVISSTDLEIGIETSFPAQVETEGAITVPARLFLELVNSLPQEKITLETKENVLEISSKHTRTTLATTPKDEFPMLYEEKGEKVVVFSSGDLKAYFGKLLFAASTETTRPALSGVLFQKSEDGKMAIVATDGYRLSLDEMVIQKQASGFTKLLIPARILKEASTIFAQQETVLYVSEKSNQVILEQEDALLVGRVIDAQFPDYTKVIPTDSATTALVDRETLLKAVKTCAIFARESANIITLSFQKEKITVSAASPQVGENIVDVETQLTGEENQIAFNARYLLEALSNIPDSQLTFSMTGPLNPGVFRIAGNNTFLHLIMPIRTTQ